MAIRNAVVGLVLVLVAPVANAQEPPPATCHKFGDTITMEGVVAERRVRMKSSGSKTEIYLFRTEPFCLVEKDGKRKVDKLRLISTADSSRYSAMSLVSGNRIRVKGVFVQVADPIIVANAIDVASVTDLEAEGGPANVEPEIPVTITFRDALLSSGKVAKFTNDTKEPLAVTVEFFRPATDRKLNRDLVVDARSSEEIGEREGWAFVKDDRITVSRKGMKTFTIIAP